MSSAAFSKNSVSSGRTKFSAQRHLSIPSFWSTEEYDNRDILKWMEDQQHTQVDIKWWNYHMVDQTGIQGYLSCICDTFLYQSVGLGRKTVPAGDQLCRLCVGCSIRKWELKLKIEDINLKASHYNTIIRFSVVSYGSKVWYRLSCKKLLIKIMLINFFTHLTSKMEENCYMKNPSGENKRLKPANKMSIFVWCLKQRP